MNTLAEKKFYVTTPIYYVNARPHLGSLYSTLLADVVARYNRLYNKKVFFLTGTDEHGQKISQAAAAVNKSPQEFVDSFIAPFKDIWRLYDIDYTRFIRTTDPEHMAAVQAWIIRLMSTGDIYKSHYAGYYCIPCETFVTEKDISVQHVNGTGPLCLSCDRTTEYVSEESYFFRLSAYQDRLLTFYNEHPDFIIPPERMAEVRSFVEGGLKDLSISRTSITWGIPFPGDNHHVTYVWADALNNYITGVGYGVPGKEREFSFWWPADLQVLGKDIVRFHAVYWPAFLMASNLLLPKKLLVHGWIKIGEDKMSKSRGNVIDPRDLAQEYGVDQVRYYLIRHLAITQDSPFTYQDLELRINADLAHDLGNLVNRMSSLALKQGLSVVVPPACWVTDESILHEMGKNILVRYIKEMDQGYIHRAYGIVWEYIHAVNKYFHNQAPWKVAKSSPTRFAEVISATCHALELIGFMCLPVMPYKMEHLLGHLGILIAEHLEQDNIGRLLTSPWHTSYTLTQSPLLFNQLERKEELLMIEEAVTSVPTVSIEDFAKIELRVGTIEQITMLEKSEKLYVLSVNFGQHGVRQILSGIRRSFSVEQLLKRQGIFVFNLAPRKMMGLESNGMMLFAKDQQEHLVLIAPEHAVPNGTLLS